MMFVFPQQEASVSNLNHFFSVFKESDAEIRPHFNLTGPSGSGRGGNYGRMSLDGQMVSVHRVVFTIFFGYIPSKKQIDHLCKQRLCCNPDHLEMVTHRENQRRK